MSVVVERNQELYSLIIDKVGDVLSLDESRIEKPRHPFPQWKDISSGVCQLESELLIIMDVARLLDSIQTQAA